MDNSDSKPRMMLKMCIKSCDILPTHGSERLFMHMTLLKDCLKSVVLYTCVLAAEPVFIYLTGSAC